MEKTRTQITKFGMYGFLKNLRFFEPYLLYYLTVISGLSLFQVGILYSIREIIIYVFEIPSGVIADKYGKKTELVFCFIFYIISFIVFFIATSYWMFIIAMILFGFGEAFRSGTHKAMIMQYLDKNEIRSSKSKIYGSTRSMSMLGSMTMSIISIIFIIWLPEVRYLFLISIIPYILDLLLIISYPKYLNDKTADRFELRDFLKENVKAVKYSFSDGKVRKLLFGASSYQAAFKSLKDYIQPIIITISMGVILFSNYSLDENLKIYVGVIYAVIYLVSSIASRNAHYVVEKFPNRTITNLMWLFTGLAMITLSFFLNNILVVFVIFLLFYVFLNIRRPLMVEQLGNATNPTKRASVLSVESQLTSLLVAVCAPIIGFIADRNMQLMFILVGSTMGIIYLYNMIFDKKKRLDN
ncbi:MFS transporter [Candidatus Izemoplasma sp. B36]|uniref:MFS transporter n=1 Tax=Candidatus Izemoplasma sp. B36 TaxID=3242468 RepID=UPI00355704C4